MDLGVPCVARRKTLVRGGRLEACSSRKNSTNWITAVTPDVSGAAMLVHLEGFMDAGAAGRLLTEHLLDAFEHTTVARFDTDRLLDYRSRRPLMTFDDGNWESYDAARAVGLPAVDVSGKPFLLLTGPEPDHEWELFVAADPDARGAARRRPDDHLLRRADGDTAHPAARRDHARHPARAGHHPRFRCRRKLQVPGSRVRADGVPVRRGGAGRDRPGRPGAALPGPGRLPDRGAHPDRRAHRGRPGSTCPRSSCARPPTGPTR